MILEGRFYRSATIGPNESTGIFLYTCMITWSAHVRALYHTSDETKTQYSLKDSLFTNLDEFDFSTHV